MRTLTELAELFRTKSIGYFGGDGYVYTLGDGEAGMIVSIIDGGCPSGLAACELNRKPLSLELPRSSTYAIEDRDGTDAGLRRTAGSDDASRDDDNEQRGSNKVARFPREIRRDSAPSVCRAEKSDVGYGSNHFDAFWRMLDAEAAAGPASAQKNPLPPIDYGAVITKTL